MLSMDFDLDAETASVEFEHRLHILLSSEAVSTTTSSQTFKFHEELRGHSVLILVDSGSSHSFVSSTLGVTLSDISNVPQPIKVQVANGQVITCTSELKQSSWTIQHVEFVTDCKLLPLPYYNVISGIDWL
jgi:hypothetical protein